MTFKTRFRSVGVASRDYFKACGTVMADRIINKIYGLEIKQLSQNAKKAKEDYPKSTKAVELATSWGFWYLIATIGERFSNFIGDTLPSTFEGKTRELVGITIGYTTAFTHPTFVSLSNGLLRLKTGFKELTTPSIRAYSTTFALLEVVSTPLALYAMSRMLDFASGSVSVPLAMLSTIAMTAITLPFEYVGFQLIWKRFVLSDFPRGNWKDGLRESAKEFWLNISRIFRKEQPKNPAKTASGYAGQIFGVMESNWIFIQLGRALVAGLVAFLYPLPAYKFMEIYIAKSAAWGKGVFDSVVSAKNYADEETKIEENNKHLGINPS